MDRQENYSSRLNRVLDRVYAGPYADIRSAYLNDPREVAQGELRTDIHLPLKSAP